MTDNTGYELGWEDEIEEGGPSFVLLPEGDYNFTVEKFERARHNGSANLPSCPMALLTLKIDGGEHGQGSVIHRLFLHSKTEGFLSNFFEAIGQKQEGERVKMNWNAVMGAQGRCKLEINKYIRDGEERQNNQVKTFLPYEQYQKHAGQQAQQAPPAQQQQQFNQQPQQQMNQPPFPGGQQQQQQGGFTPGSF